MFLSAITEQAVHVTFTAEQGEGWGVHKQSEGEVYTEEKLKLKLKY